MAAFPEIVGSAEAAEILNIGPTNFAHMRKNKSPEDGGFPEPVTQLRCGPIWLKRDVIKFEKSYTSGRSRSKVSEDAPAPKKAAAKKSPAKKTVAKKAPSKKAAATKTVSKAAPAKKAPAKKAPSKKVSPSKSTARKTIAKASGSSTTE